MNRGTVRKSNPANRNSTGTSSNGDIAVPISKFSQP